MKNIFPAKQAGLLPNHVSGKHAHASTKITTKIKMLCSNRKLRVLS